MAEQQQNILDSQNLQAVISALPAQILRAWDFTTQATFNQISNVFICGMGGSALPANIFKTFTQNESPLFQTPIHIIRDYDLPKSFDQNSGGIFISYSGNTEETISCLNQALKISDKNIIVMATGGQLEKIAIDKNLPFVKIPNDVSQPRLAYGYFWGSLLKIFFDSQLLQINLEQIKSETNKILTDMAVLENQGKELAEKLVNKIPIIYTSDKWKYLAMIIKINFNENAKIQSFWNAFPELNHNEMVGFTQLLADYQILIFKDPNDHERNQKRIDVFSQIMRDKMSVQIIPMPQAPTFTIILTTLLIGLWASYYLALRYEIDPAPVDMVEDFKNKI